MEGGAFDRGREQLAEALLLLATAVRGVPRQARRVLVGSLEDRGSLPQENVGGWLAAGAGDRLLTNRLGAHRSLLRGVRPVGGLPARRGSAAGPGPSPTSVAATATSSST